jgi:hypothetical protein
VDRRTPTPGSPVTRKERFPPASGTISPAVGSGIQPRAFACLHPRPADSHAGLLVQGVACTHFLAVRKHRRRWTAASGLAITFIPPAGVSSLWRFELKLAGSVVVLVATARFFFLRARRPR